VIAIDAVYAIDIAMNTQTSQIYSCRPNPNMFSTPTISFCFFISFKLFFTETLLVRVTLHHNWG
jgi:hypothetical protein